VRPWPKVKVAKSDGLKLEAKILQKKQLKLAVIKMEGQIAEYCAQFAHAERSMRKPSFEEMPSLHSAHRDTLQAHVAVSLKKPLRPFPGKALVSADERGSVPLAEIRCVSVTTPVARQAH
jgi:hypothetical protein